MEEKYMVNDILEEIKTKILAYHNAICEAQNIKLRQTLQQIRDNEETFQYEIFKIAEIKGYYKSGEKSTQIHIKKIKNELED